MWSRRYIGTTCQFRSESQKLGDSEWETHIRTAPHSRLVCLLAADVCSIWWLFILSAPCFRARLSNRQTLFLLLLLRLRAFYFIICPTLDQCDRRLSAKTGH